MVAKSPSYLRKKSLIFRDKYVFPYPGLIFPYQGLFVREIWDLEARKFMDKYPLLISRLYPFINNDLAMCGRMADWGTEKFRRATLKLAFGKIPWLLHTGFWILPFK